MRKGWVDATKDRAKYALLAAMGIAFERTDDPELVAEMDYQMRRVEKLFGFEPGTSMRGC